MAYHNVTTSFEYVFVGTDFALARPSGNESTLWHHFCILSYQSQLASGLLVHLLEGFVV